MRRVEEYDTHRGEKRYKIRYRSGGKESSETFRNPKDAHTFATILDGGGVTDARKGEPFSDGSGIAEIDEFPHYPFGSDRAELAYMANVGHPSRALAECEAKRRIVGLHAQPILFGGVEHWAHELRHLAAIYSNHPDYDEVWRV